MSDLKTSIQDAVKDAMRARDKVRLKTLRMATAEIKRVEVDERIEVDDARVLALLDRMIRQRAESERQYREAGRDDLADAERAEITVLEEFLPEPLGEDELARLIDDAVARSGADGMRDMGKVMGLLKPEVQGRADMAAVSAAVKARLSG